MANPALRAGVAEMMKKIKTDEIATRHVHSRAADMTVEIDEKHRYSYTDVRTGIKTTWTDSVVEKRATAEPKSEPERGETFGTW